MLAAYLLIACDTLLAALWCVLAIGAAALVSGVCIVLMAKAIDVALNLFTGV